MRGHRMGDVPVVDVLGRFESLKHDYEAIFRYLGCASFEGSLHANSTNREDFTHYYDDASRRTVEHLFARDIALFDYQFAC